MVLFLLFLAVPLIEIALFITVGSAIGLFPTLAIVIITAIVGTLLVRQQGFAVLQQVSGSFNNLEDPTEPLAHGAMILFSGALLLTPGFFTDAFGFALLVPAFRSAVFKFAKARIKVKNVQFSSHGARASFHDTGDMHRAPDPAEDIIEADYTDLEQPKGPSGWTKPNE